MRSFKVALMLLFSMWFNMAVCAQTISSIVELNLPNSSNEIVRVCQIGGQEYLICFSEHPGKPITRYFTLINTTTNASCSFAFNASVISGTIQNGVVGRTVSDVCVNEGYCYFCGKENYLTAGAHSSRGYIGRFSLADVLAGSGSVDIVRVSNTTSIDNLAVSGLSRVQIFATANVPEGPSFMTTDGFYNTSCLVEVDYEMGAVPSQQWSSCIVAPINTDEVFTDIDMVEYGVGIVSKFRGSHQKFCVRNMKDGNGSMIDGDNWAHIQTANVFQNANDERTCRRESDKIFIGGGSSFFVAHSVDSNGKYGIAVYRMGLGTEPSHVEAMSTKYWRNSVYESLLDIGAESNIGSDLVTRCGGYCNIHYAYINWPNLSIVFSQRCDLPTLSLNSIATSNSGYYYSIGHGSNGKMTYCKQCRQSIGRNGLSCMGIYAPYVQSPNIPTKLSGEGLWIYQHKMYETATTNLFTVNSIPTSVICEFLNN